MSKNSKNKKHTPSVSKESTYRFFNSLEFQYNDKWMVNGTDWWIIIDIWNKIWKFKEERREKYNDFKAEYIKIYNINNINYIDNPAYFLSDHNIIRCMTIEEESFMRYWLDKFIEDQSIWIWNHVYDDSRERGLKDGEALKLANTEQLTFTKLFY